MDSEKKETKEINKMSMLILAVIILILVILNKEIIFVPIKDIANKFVRIVRPFYVEIDLVRNKNQNLKETRDFLLPRLISGKLDIKDLHIV